MILIFQLTFFLYLFAAATYLVFFFNQNDRLRTMARITTITAGVIHLTYTAARFIHSGHTPITSNHEAVSFFALAVTWGYLSFRWRYKVKNFGVFVSPIVAVLMFVASRASQQLTELPPALQSLWLPVHASIAVMANAFLALAFCGGIMYLLQEREIKNKKFGLFYSRLPSLEALDNLNRHCLAVGFPLMTLGIITGSIWAKQAWGAYWQWDPKETWSLITWFIYAAILHQRFTAGWRRRRVAIMAIIGFASALFTLWGVNFLLEGLHSYAG
ncbi:MAG: c-type cytochrome biogenesis protein CcsB [Proteobacteria bacterium]|nr:c-type cytochrome biogenesis protein CcsB [Pseudomonadota bacterium]MBU1687636.1 c-type cytochrome biogenesis protein CcsB [Pseudomonadota bacterium]